MTHFFAAGEADRAGLMLAMLLHSLAQESREISPGLLLAIAWGKPLPDGMSVGVQIYLRHAQGRIAQRYDKDASSVEEELDGLLGRASDTDAWAVVLAETERFERRFGDDPEKAATSFEKALAAAAHARLPDGTVYPIPDLTPLVWARATELATHKHLQVWLRVVRFLRGAARVGATGGVRAERACQHACDRIWLREHRKPQPEAKWAEAYEDLDVVIAAAREMTFPYLEACALRGRITILCEQAGRFEDGAALGAAFLAAHGSDPACVMLIEDVLGRQHDHAGHMEDALAHLERALVEGPRVEPHLACLTANYASRAASSLDPSRSLALAELSVSIARSTPEVPFQAELQALGEHAIAHWHAGDTSACVRDLFEAGERFRTYWRDDARVRHVRVALVQVLFSLSLAIMKGVEESGNAIPARGFMHDQPRSSVEWRKDFTAVVASALCRLADAREDEATAMLWAQRLVELGPRDADDELSAAPRLAVIAYVILSEGEQGAPQLIEHFVSTLQASRTRPGETPIESLPMIIELAALAPAILSLAATRVDKADVARDLAAVCADRLGHLVAPGAQVPWEDLASLVRAPHDGVSALSLFAQARALESADDEWLRRLITFQASICTDVPLGVAAGVHAHLAPHYADPRAPRPLRRTFERFVARYWTRTFETSRIAFAAPAQVERVLRRSAPEDVGVRARRILEAVADDQRVKLGSQARAWLQEGA